jgi:general secretion pathway protein G
MPVYRRKSGLTLIELMIVIAIIGILSGLATIKYLGYIEKVRVARAILDVKSLQTEIDACMYEGGPPPASLAVIGTSTAGGDGRTKPILTSPRSQDDVLRANNGGFIGLAVHY